MFDALYRQFHDAFLEIAKKSLADPVDAIVDVIVRLKANPGMEEDLLKIYERCQLEIGIS